MIASQSKTSFWFWPAEKILSWLELIFDMYLMPDLERMALGFITLIFWLYVLKAVIAIIQKILGFQPRERQR